MRPFRIAFTGDFLGPDGRSAYGDIGRSLLDAAPHIHYRFLTDQAPRVGDPNYYQRFYSLEVTADHVVDLDGLIVLRPWVRRHVFEYGAGDLVVIGRSGAGYDKVDVAACTETLALVLLTLFLVLVLAWFNRCSAADFVLCAILLVSFAASPAVALTDAAAF